MEHLVHVETSCGENNFKLNKNKLITLKMSFAPNNAHFSNETLQVSVEYDSENKVKHIEGTIIEWL